VAPELLSIVVPAYNEARTIAQVLRRVDGEELGGPYEVIVVDDGSTDSTADLAEGLGLNEVRVIRLPANRGKGAAVRALYEVPISYYGRTYAEGKKIRWRDGVAAVAALVRYRVLP
jgi:glycosyltransferase involved in cell wall biosynthesis